MNEKPAKFIVTKQIPAEFDSNSSTEHLWREHARLTDRFRAFENQAKAEITEKGRPARSYLDLKIEIAKRIMRGCRFCTRRCGARRSENETGYCKCDNRIRVSTIFEHMGEEPELVPSGTVFTMGCTMQCLHCQNWTISQWMEEGEVYAPEDLAKQVETLRTNGCRNANLVGGDPTPWLEQWLETFKHVDLNIPVDWNSNSYYSPETAELLAGFADVYLLDFKYGPGECADRISDAPDYWSVCTYNHLKAKQHGELIIRVLVLPEHLECCSKPIFRWIAENLGLETRVNIMFQYKPEWRAYEVPELRRSLNRNEMERAIELARESGLTNLVR